MSNTTVKSYKGFDKDLKCRGFQYESNKEYEEEKAKACECGFHACEYPLDIFDYYPPAHSRYCAVEQSGEIDKSEEKKIASTKIKIGAELSIAGLVKAAIEYTRRRCTNEHNASPGNPATAGDRGAATAGDRGAATAGNYGAATAGDSGAATAGNRGAATAGDRGAATAGDYGAATAGDSGAATSRGRSRTGKNGLCVARGIGVMACGGLGSILIIVEENEDCSIKEWQAAIVDGDNVKADTWYRLSDGIFVEIKE